MNYIEPLRIIVPLGSEAHNWAQQFAAEQATPLKGKKVYLNTLAVYAVHSYLQWLQIETDLNQSDSWQPGLRSLFDVADLVVPGAGRLECRPILPEEIALSLPLEATLDRIGCVAVQFSEYLNEVELLGFIEAEDLAIPEQILVSDFQSLDILLDCIRSQLNRQISMSIAGKGQVNISLWQQNIFDVDWLSVPALFSRVANPAFNARSSNLLKTASLADSANKISRGKIIDLGIQIIGYPLALIVTITPVTNEEIDILAQVYPAGGRLILPKNLQLIVQDEAEENSMEVQARDSDNWIQLEFSGEKNERFSINVALDDVGITEYFVI